MRMTAESGAATRATELLTALVRVDSINPMGSPYDRNEPVERRAIEVVERWLEPCRSRLSFERQACGGRHESLIVRLEGQADTAAALFESHLDTVPADDWRDRALHPVVCNGELFGRGACDDKGSAVGMILALERLAESGVTPPRPIVLLLAGDEEFAQTGIRRFRDTHDRPLAYGVFGEPTQLCPVIQHKGTIRWDVTVAGASAHTSQPELGDNAVLGMMQVVAALGRYQESLQLAWTSPFMTGPLVTVTMIRGGRTRNATPDECTIAVDFRILPGMDPTAEKQRLVEYLDRELDLKIRHGENQLMTPALATDPESELCEAALTACRAVAGDHVRLRGAPYGTDAAWVSDLCPAVVLGPGDIAFAHAIDERVAISQVVASAEIYHRLMLEPLSDLPV
ncbi:M20/M25/M40 family metallo-hydrolase [Botrimarina sp.]|uniref:M20 family metallopeptidase n=1 Tax=Botrimarina sp. TaxID=2795802 RepID=UPI0032EECBE4